MKGSKVGFLILAISLLSAASASASQRVVECKEITREAFERAIPRTLFVPYGDRVRLKFAGTGTMQFGELIRRYPEGGILESYPSTSQQTEGDGSTSILYQFRTSDRNIRVARAFTRSGVQFLEMVTDRALFRCEDSK